MQVDQFIKAVGGRKLIMELTGLSKGRISQWVTENRVPKPWLKYFQQRFPSQYRRAGGPK